MSGHRDRQWRGFADLEDDVEAGQGLMGGGLLLGRDEEWDTLLRGTDLDPADRQLVHDNIEQRKVWNA